METKWFEVRIQYNKSLENGMEKKVTEAYMTEALTHSEAEARMIEHIRPYISGEFDIVAVRKAKYAEIFFMDDESADYWYKCKLAFIVLDERTGQEKKTNANILVNASDIRDAIKRLDEGMKSTMSDYVITSVAETPIIEVHKYE